MVPPATAGDAAVGLDDPPSRIRNETVVPFASVKAPAEYRNRYTDVASVTTKVRSLQPVSFTNVVVVVARTLTLPAYACRSWSANPATCPAHAAVPGSPTAGPVIVPIHSLLCSDTSSSSHDQATPDAPAASSGEHDKVR